MGGKATDVLPVEHVHHPQPTDQLLIELADR
jgi:hypothetical protein